MSTDAKLTPEQIIEAYGERWSIESMFNQLKLSWGLKEAWQQTRQTLHRWVHLTLVGYGLIQLLGYLDDQTVRQLCCHSPWRKDIPTTAGQLRRCQPWRAKRRLVVPSSREAALFSRRALRQRENKVGLRTRRPVIWEPSTEQQRACEVVA